MPAAFARARIFTDLPCNGGAYVCELPVVSLETVERIENHVVYNRLTTSIYSSWENKAQLIVRRVVQIEDVLGAIEEYRISSIVDSIDGDTIELRADGIIFDLAQGDSLVTKTVSPATKLAWKPDPAFSTALLTEVLAFAPAYFAVGTVGAANYIDPEYDSDTVLSALVKQLVLLQLATGGSYELSARRNGTTNYLVDITQIGASLALQVRTGNNIVGLQRTLSTDLQVTRCVPVGVGGSGIGDAQFNVTAVVPGVSITIACIDNAGAFAPVIESNVFNGLYWIHEDGVAHQITASAWPTNVLSMASTAGIAVNEWGRIALNAAGDYLTYLDYPSKQATYGKLVKKISVNVPAVTNWMKHGDFAAFDWVGANPPDWTTALNPFTKVTTSGFWQVGGASAYTGAAANVVSLLGDRSVYCPAGSTVTYFWRIYFTRITGVVTSDHTDIGNPNTGTNDQWNYDPGTSVASSLQVTTGQWYEFTKSYSVTAAGVKNLHFGFWRDGTVVGGGGLYYVDCAQVTITPQGVDAPAQFVRHSGAALVFGAGLAKLSANADPVATYEVTVLDRTRADAVTWPYEAFDIGSGVTLTEPGLGIATPFCRIYEIQRNWLDPYATKLVLTNSLQTLTGLLAA